jgi:hypothetical protein
MNPVHEEFRNVATAIVEGQSFDRKFLESVCRRANKTTVHLVLTVARLAARKEICEVLEMLLRQYPEVKAMLSNVTPGSELEERARNTLRQMEPAYEFGRTMLLETADNKIRETAIFTDGKIALAAAMRETFESRGNAELARHIAAVENHFVAEHARGLAQCYEWKNCEPV